MPTADGTRLNTFMGTPEYVSPEQATNARSADIRSDIYSLGCALYFLLAGRPPFQKDTALNTILAQVQEEAVPVDEACPAVPAALTAVVARMMAKEPEGRYQTPAEVAKALQPFVGAGKKTAAADAGEVPAAGAARAGGSPTALRADTGEMTPVPSPSRVLPPPVPGVAQPAPSRATGRRGKGLGKPRWLGTKVYVASAVAGLMTMAALALIVLAITTPEGTLELRVNERGAKVSLDGEEINIHVPGEMKPIKIQIQEGRHEVKVEKGGFEGFTHKFVWRKGAKEVVKVELKRRKREAGPQANVAARKPDGFIPLVNGKPLSKSERFRKQPVEYLAGTRWQFYCPEDKFVSTVLLKRGGAIGNSPHPQEARWKVVGERIVFCREDGSETSWFSLFREKDNRLEFRGPFAFNGWTVKLLEVVE
jgi:hypothetical protein